MESEPISPTSPSPTSNQGSLPLKVMPAPPPKENAWAKRSLGGGANEKEAPPSANAPINKSAPRPNRKEVKRDKDPRIASEPKKYEESAPPVSTSPGLDPSMRIS